MRVLLLHNAVGLGDGPDVADVMAQVAAVGPTLEADGHELSVAPCDLDLEALRRRLTSDPPDVVFNLVESLGGQDRLLFLVPALLDALGVPYTGSPTAALLTATDKLATKRALAAAGLPVPPCLAIWPPDAVHAPPAPEPAAQAPHARVILKSVWDHGSPELDDDSVFPDLASLEEAVAAGRTRLRRPFFAEPYVAGREINVALLAVPADPSSSGLDVLPAAEIRFEDFPPDKPHIVGFRAKWQADSFEYRNTPRSFAFPPSDRELLGRLDELARRACAALGIGGYARVDFRVGEDGSPYILEVNANPCLSPDAGFAAAVQAAGLSFEETVRRVLAAAGARREERPRQAQPPPEAPRPRQSASPVPGFRAELTAADPGRVGELLTATGFFRHQEIEIGVELAHEALARGAEASGYHFLFADGAERAAGYSCFGPVPLTVDSWDLYWIAVDPSQQGRGLGRQLLAESERAIHALGGRQLFVDTSSRPDYAPTRAFYLSCGYRVAAELTDFYGPGDGKVIFHRSLRGRAEAGRPGGAEGGAESGAEAVAGAAAGSADRAAGR